jgi:hypothetical protein
MKKKGGKAVYRYVARKKEQLRFSDVRLTEPELRMILTTDANIGKLYLFLNSRRDFETQISGEKTLLSDRAFKEAMSYENEPGKRGYQPSTTQIKSWLKKLEVLGLIERRGKYIFFLPFSYSKEGNVQERFHRGFTKGFTKSEVIQLNDYKEEICNSKTEVSPEVLPRFHYLRDLPVNTKLNNNNARDFENFEKPCVQKFNDYYRLLSDRKFALHLQQHPKTFMMLKSWGEAGVTFEEAKAGMDYADTKRGAIPEHPAYYKNCVLQAKRDLTVTQETNHHDAKVRRKNTASKILADWLAQQEAEEEDDD